MGRGKFKGKPARPRERQFTDPEEFKERDRQAKQEKEEDLQTVSEEESESEVETDDDDDHFVVEPLNKRVGQEDLGQETQLSRREKEEIDKQKSQRLLEKGKTEQARKDLERLALLRQDRADAAKKREEEKAAKEEMKKVPKKEETKKKKHVRK